jgi:plasmid maintenance system antidote protein VapI
MAFSTTPELRLNLRRNYDLREAAHKSNDGKLVEAMAV